jgi:hypothetical protein
MPSGLLPGAEADYVPKTVLLKLVCVLRAAYGLQRPAILKAMLHNLELPVVPVE